LAIGRLAKQVRTPLAAVHDDAGTVTVLPRLSATVTAPLGGVDPLYGIVTVTGAVELAKVPVPVAVSLEVAAASVTVRVPVAEPAG
jgi:hypothetical protein